MCPWLGQFFTAFSLLPPEPTNVATPDTAEVASAAAADRLAARIDAALDRYSRFDDGCPPDLGEAIRYALLAPGKRLRPRLVLLAAEACGGTVDDALPAACCGRDDPRLFAGSRRPAGDG